MNATVNEITRSLTGKSSLDDCNVDDLRQIASQYPFFSPAQLIFTKKLKEENSFAYEAQLHKAFLYFQNPLWLHYLVHESTNAVTTSVGLEHVADNEAKLKDEVAAPEVQPASQPGQPEKTTGDDIVLKDKFVAGPETDTFSPTDEEELATDAVEEDKQESSAEFHPLKEFKFQAIDPSKAAMTFEPYHTVDYFASQGIRVKEEEKPKDRFTVQLKSFTEWLKVMKRLPPAELAAQVTPSEEKKVEQMAAVSINDRDVVTEAMAEVWEKQGNAAKAREIYEKLSLLNPGKSSYFAAKIEHLKNL